MRFSYGTAAAACLLGKLVGAVQVDFTNDQSVKDAAGTIAFGLMKYYTGNNTGDVPGNLPDPYFWWEAGAMLGTMLDYQLLTGDQTYNDVIFQALLHQAGEDEDYRPKNQSRSIGNDDQGFWAMSAMTAAENNFQNPPEDQPQWLALVQAVFNEHAMRWDPATCGGGLRWQINPLSNGFDYKNSISNGCFFNIAARLARYTGNQTYADWAAKIFDWEEATGLITPDYKVYDGAAVVESANCPKLDMIQWSYNAGIFMHGSAVMHNFTQQDIWKTRTEGILTESEAVFFNNSVMSEQACEPFGFCDIDQRSFKGYLTRWMAGSAQMIPDIYDRVMGLLIPNAEGAAAACSGSPAAGFSGIQGTACGLQWQPKGFFDGLVGVGEQMNALSAVMYTLVKKTTAAPVTADSGGTSVGDVNAGMSASPDFPELKPPETKDRVAAGFITTAMLLSVVGGCILVVK